MPRDFHIVYQPNPAYVLSHSRRFLVSANTLERYIGKANAETVLEIAAELTEDKHRKRFRKYGIVDIYLK